MAKVRTRILALLCALFILVSAQPFALAEEPANLLKNGGFETVITDGKGTGDEGWVLSVPDWASVTLTNNNGDAQKNQLSGERALNYWTQDAKTLALSQSVSLTAGKYKLTAKLMGEKNTVSLLAGDASSSVTVNSWSTWADGTLEFELAEDNADVTVTISLDCEAGGCGYIDDVTLVRVGDATPVEIALENGDFESGEKNWTIDGTKYSVVANEWASNNLTNTLDIKDSNETFSASYTVTLTAGTYYFTFRTAGVDGSNGGFTSAVTGGGKTLVAQTPVKSSTGWDVWIDNETDKFTLTEDTKVTFTYASDSSTGYWGNLDDLRLYGTGSVTKVPDKVTADIYVPYVEGTDGDFIRGGDVSALLSILKSGGRFQDRSGASLGDTVDEQGAAFMALLKDAGYNWVRLRVWNDPYDADRNGYGGGNNDIDAAVTMGKWATDAGLRVLIDFHYSDFWADPGKQQVPKAWKDMDVDAKATAIADFTTKSLQALKEAKVDVGMVQVGNETNASFCGEKSWDNIAKLFIAGSNAVKEVDENILVALHFTNPEAAGRQAGYAKELSDRNVPYDVFASSYYPYWHGTPENLTSVLSGIAKTYGKKVMVAETSWAWTLEDGDGHANTVAVGSNDTPTYPFSVQGQAVEVATVAQAVRNIGDAGIGMFYWESAWIPVSNVNGLTGDAYDKAVAANREKWEQFGSGWASSYAKEYDPEDAGVWYGGSAIDNQAFFDFDGKPLKSLDVYKYMQTGTEGYLMEITSVDEPSEEIEAGGSYTLPETVTVTYTDTTSEKLEVTWSEADKAKIDVNTAGTYTVSGTVTKGELTASVTYTLTVKLPNLLKNPGFEEGDTAYTLSGWEGKGPTSAESSNNHSGKYCLHFYSAAAMTGMTTEQTVTLEPGVYTFTLYAQGDAVGSDADIHSYVKIGDEVTTEPIVFAGWSNWVVPTIEFTVTQTTDVTVGVSVTAAAGGWGAFDDWYLCKTGEYTAPCAHPEESVEHVAAKEATYDAEGNIEYWHCEICDKYFKAEPLTEENEIAKEDTVVAKLERPNPDPDPNPDEPDEPSTPSTPTDPDVTTSGGETTITPDVTTGAAEVTEELGGKLVEQTKDKGSDTAVVAPEFDEDADSAAVSIPGSVVKDLGDKTDADLRVETPVADVTIPNGALSGLGKGESVSVAVEKTDDGVTVTVAADNEVVETVPGGLKVAVDLGDGQVAVLVGDDGTETVIPKSVVEDGVTYVILEGSGTVKAADNTKDFADVKAADWFSSAVDFATSHKLFDGTSATTFEPTTVMSRAMLATVLWRLESEADAATASTFPDVDADQWYTEGVAWASENEIVLGKDGGKFGTNDPVTRQELAVMLSRYAKLMGIDTSAKASLGSFTDGAKTDTWAQDAMMWAVSAGLINGKDGNRLDPTGTATRAEVAIILQRMVALLVK